MAVAVSASFMNVTVAHIEGGEITGTIDESIRHAISKLSHLHFVSTATARERLITMGERRETVHHTGCPAMDIICNIDTSKAADACRNLNPEKTLMPGQFLIVSHHPVTSDVEQSLREFDIITDAIMQLEIPTVLLFPNVDAGSKEMVRISRLKGTETAKHVICQKHIPFDTYMQLLASTRCLIGNSSAGIREAGAFGTPSINIGTRQSCREHGESVCDIPELSLEALVEAISTHGTRRFEKDFRYGDGNASTMMVKHMKEANLDTTQKQFVDN